MPAASQRAFEEKVEKIKKNVLCSLTEYYGNAEEQKEASTDLVKYGIFYSNSCDQLLEAALLYRYEVEPFAQKNLIPETKLELNKEEFRRHHYSLLMQYYIDQIVMELILNGKIDKTKAQTASDFHYKNLKEYDYTEETDVIKELDTESMLSIFVRQMIVRKLLGADYSNVVEYIDPAIKSNEKIWMYAWRLLYRLYGNESSDLGKCWNDLLQEWKSCLVKSDFHNFRNSCFVLLYYLYCQSINQDFDIKDLSFQVVKP